MSFDSRRGQVRAWPARGSGSWGVEARLPRAVAPCGEAACSRPPRPGPADPPAAEVTPVLAWQGGGGHSPSAVSPVASGSASRTPPSAAWGAATLSARPRGARARGRRRPAQRAGAAAAAPLPGPCPCGDVAPVCTFPRPRPRPWAADGSRARFRLQLPPEETGLVAFHSRPFSKSSFRLEESNLGTTCSQMRHVRVVAWQAAAWL